MADLIDDQRETIKRIARIVENLKKLGAAKMTEGAIRSRLDTLEEAWADFKVLHRDIRKAAKEYSALKTNEYFSKNFFDLTEESYMEQRGLLLDILKRAEGTQTAGSSKSKPTAVEVTETKSRAILPRIPLPTFGGRYTDWPSFRDLFTSLIINDAALTPVDRLHYLKTALTGEAALHLKNRATTDRNFQPAWEALQARYENKRRLVRAQLSTLSNMTPAARESAEEVKRVLFGTCDVIGALSELGRPVTDATDWLVHITVERLDHQSRKEWEMSLGPSSELPTFDELKTFLNNRIDTLEALEEKRRGGDCKEVKKPSVKAAKVHQVSAPSNTAKECSLCQGKHYVAFCPLYQQKTPAERQEIIKAKQLCFNCLGKHNLASCLSVKRCKLCEERHHTSLHDVLHVAGGTTVQHAALPEFQTSRVILSTARVKLQSLDGSFTTVRSLIDPASEVSLIAESLVQRLGLQRQSARLPLIGVGGARSRFTKGYTKLTVASLLGEVCLQEISALILPELSRHRPRTFPEEKEWHHLRDLPLADPWFQQNDPVELLLGADVYNKILRGGVRLGGPNAPVAQETCLGWILNGGIEKSVNDSETVSDEKCIHHCAVDQELVSLLIKFWEQEEISVAIPAKPEDEECERQFLQTIRRTDEGRFEVRLPFKTIPELGDSRRAASRTLAAMQRKFTRSAEFRKAYQEFMAEYESLGHMKQVAPSCENLGGNAGFYLPHHGVWKDSSTTTKLRVVFNGSMKTESGKSLNDLLHTGPNLLPPLAEVLLRWRRHAVAFIADVEKMYRQIRVHCDDWRWQRILWNNSSGEAPHEYQLCTVTYGFACAPYLAIRCIHQLADDEAARFPVAARILRRDVYGDDVLSGASTLDEARTLQRELYDLLMAGGFPLRKWASNSKELLSDITSGDPGEARSWSSSSQHCVLGIDWLPFLDCFKVTVSDGPSSSGITSKRAVLSKTAQLFDPLGWLSPVTIVAKILIQTLWLLKVDWDTPLPPREEQQWSQFVQELPMLNSIEIPRWLGWLPSSQLVELHGFADASERAYAAVLYIRVVDASGDSSSTLVTAKTKVAPLKQVSIPRLELCAAWLLTRMTSHALTILELEKVNVHLWSDSLVTLGWIRGHPTRWATYVANRVSAIQQALPLAIWHHVQGKDNPADCASRGLSPGDLPNFSLWWRGPSWLNSPDLWPVTEIPIKEPTVDQRIRSLHSQLPVEDEVSRYISRFSDLQRLFKVTALCCRWLPASKGTRGAPLTSTDIHAARTRLVRGVQGHSFREEVNSLRQNKPISAKSRLLKLSPFLDDGLLRVGGRLQGAALPYDRTHPLIIPDESPLASMWVKAAHLRCLHGGVQLTLATLRQECWVLRGRSVVKACLRACLNCFRWRQQTPVQLMGYLPRARVVPCRPFLKVGIDYAGPILVRSGRGRGQRSVKGYIALFICLATKAVHLEVVSDGSSETFLAALKRFVARRGICTEIYSDCGTNFVGANRELRALLQAANLENHNFLTAIAAEGIKWNFNPPAAPHFGGLWEAGVKSVKHHLRRQMGDRRLSFEELSTLLAGIEACLNSRPLEPLSDDPEDFQALTPGHFLIGGPLIAIPEPSLEELPASRLSRWQLMQQMQQHFWRRWSREYLNTLQTRAKWCRVQPNIQPGTLCLLKQDLLPPTRWPRARVTEVHAAADGLIRVVTVRTANAKFVRPINKIIPLPKIEESMRDAGGSSTEGT